MIVQSSITTQSTIAYPWYHRHFNYGLCCWL